MAPYSAESFESLAAVNECNKQKEWTEGDGTSKDSFHQKGRPATQKENMNK